MDKKSIIEFIKNNIQDIIQGYIVELQRQRFNNQGKFLDHEKWVDNALDVILDKGRNEPLVDTGDLKNSLQTKSNWNLKQKTSATKVQLTIPEKEKFTAKKYDKLQTGVQQKKGYTSIRGHKMPARIIPPRDFKTISDIDVDWIVNLTVNKLKRVIK